MVRSCIGGGVVCLLFATSLLAQEGGTGALVPATTVASASAIPPLPIATIPGGNRMFGVLPNYRTASASDEGTILPAKRKLFIARKDSTDYPLFFVTGIFAGLNQWTDQEPSFGQGAKGFGHRYATNYIDLAVGNVLAEGVFPVLLHQDPRYFVRGSGPKWSRAKYALTRVLITRQDGHGKNFNYSEWLGNASAVALSNLYYPDGRNFTNNYRKLLWQVGTDGLSQLLKEFWPDLQRKFFRRGDKTLLSAPSSR